MTVTRPPRTDGHRQRDALLQQFSDAGLVPVISTNGGIPDADIQVVKGEKPGEVLECWMTERGKFRLAPLAATAMPLMKGSIRFGDFT